MKSILTKKSVTKTYKGANNKSIVKDLVIETR